MLSRNIIARLSSPKSQYISPFSLKKGIYIGQSSLSTSNLRFYSHNHTKEENEKKTNKKETDDEVVIEVEKEELDGEDAAKQERIRREVAKRVAAAQAAKEVKSSIKIEQAKEEQPSEEKVNQEGTDDQEDINESIGQTKVIYSAFTTGILLLAGFALYKAPFWTEGASFMQPPSDVGQILRDIFEEHRKLIEDGGAEFNSLVPAHTTYINEVFIKILIKDDSMTIYIPILEKSSQSLLASGNIDIVKEGKYFKVCNLFIDAVNGYHFDIDIPDIRYDTTSPKYTQSF